MKVLSGDQESTVFCRLQLFCVGSQANAFSHMKGKAIKRRTFYL